MSVESESKTEIITASTTTPSFTMTTLSKSFPLSTFVTYLRAVQATHPGVPIVEIGSANGIDAQYIHDHHDITFRYLIEPNPGEWTTKRHVSSVDNLPLATRKPDFPHVDDLVRANPEIVKNCIVVIVWPYPTKMNGIDYKRYDYQAIRTLKPLSVLLVYEPSGQAGSDKLLKWIFESGGYGGYDGDDDADTHVEIDNNAVVGDTATATVTPVTVPTYHHLATVHRIEWEFPTETCPCSEKSCWKNGVMMNVCLSWFLRRDIPCTSIVCPASFQYGNILNASLDADSRITGEHKQLIATEIDAISTLMCKTVVKHCYDRSNHS